MVVLVRKEKNGNSKRQLLFLCKTPQPIQLGRPNSSRMQLRDACPRVVAELQSGAKCSRFPGSRHVIPAKTCPRQDQESKNCDPFNCTPTPHSTRSEPIWIRGTFASSSAGLNGMSLDIGAKDAALRERAAKVVPGMLWGHLNVTRYGGGMGGFPQWFTRAEGAKLYDVDGKEYIDLMCAYGPVVLGPNDPDVEKAVDEARTLGPVMTGPSPLLVELSEYIVDLVPHADWCIFLKNGTDATTTCVTIARAQTKKRKVLVAKGAYHGAVPWVSPSLVGVTAEDRAHIITFEWNNIASLEEAAAKAKGDLAGILVSAFQHDLGKDHTMPTPEFAKRCRALCDEAGAALIVDDVRAGMRLHLGGSWELVGVRPDLSAWSKAVANGYPMGFVTGNDKFRQGAASVYVTGSFWCESIGIAACLATLRKLKALDGPEYMRRMGQRLRDGIQKQADERGIPISQSGPPQMPLVLFKDDKFGEWKRGMLWSRVAMKNGAYFHPTHTMFVSVHHTEQDIDRALQASAAGMDAVAKEFGYKAKL